MKRYQLIIAYDGAPYCGWQVQADRISVAQALQETFLKVFGHEIVVLGASRTDAGVHAYGQVALIRTPLSLDPERLRWAWNNALPSSIHIRTLRLVSDSFHPFHNVSYKTYHYEWVAQRPLPLQAPYVWHIFSQVDNEKLERALSVFVGTHDFRAFSTDEDIKRNTVCTIFAIRLERITDDRFRIVVVGNRFLRHMVRRIVGAAIKVASVSHLDELCIAEALAQKKIGGMLPTAPAQGLMLYEIVYNQ